AAGGAHEPARAAATGAPLGKHEVERGAEESHAE
ncbi:MAG: hypothetical protein JWR24_1585, partial [Actinoallomurus sp.]|nr:hypothetical protein [Actinoallomurus sp.]